MNKELIFAQTLEKVKEIAKMQGNCIHEEDVKEEFSALELDEEQLQMVFDYLVKHKIGINQPINLDEYLTTQEHNYLQDYMEELQQLEVISDGVREAITISAMAGDETAQSKLIEAYLLNVVEISKIYSGQGVTIEDLIGEGNVALSLGVTMLGCVEHAKEAEGLLIKMIMDAMEQCISENVTSEKIDQKIVDKVNLVADKANELYEELHRKVTIDELLQETAL